MDRHERVFEFERQLWRIAGIIFESDKCELRKLKQIADFIIIIGFDDVLFAAEKAAERIDDDLDDRFRYFCGICWRKKSDKELIKNPFNSEKRGAHK
jgi:hypothetical protein